MKSPADISPRHLMSFSNQVPYGQFQHLVHIAHRTFPVFDHRLLHYVI